MYNTTVTEANSSTSIIVDKSSIQEGEKLEQKLSRILETNAISDEIEAPLIYTEKSEGVINMYNIRYDKFEGLIEAKDATMPAKVTEAVDKKKAELKAQQEAAEGNDRIDQEK